MNTTVQARFNDPAQKLLDAAFDRLLQDNARSMTAVKELIVEAISEIQDRASIAEEGGAEQGSKRRKILRAEQLPDVCTPQVAADYLGISRTRVYEYCGIAPEAGGIPSYLIGGSRKIDKADLIRWKEAQKAAAAERFGR